MPITAQSVKRIILRPIRITFEAVIAFIDDNGFILASSVSFYFLLSIIPFTLFALTILQVLLRDPEFAGKLYNVLSVLLAKDDVVIWFRDTFIVNILTTSTGQATFWGAVTLLFVSTGMFRSLEYVMNRVFGVRPRSFFKSYLIGFSFSLILNILLIIGVTASPIFGVAALISNPAIKDLVDKIPGLAWGLDSLFSWFVFWGLCMLIYSVLPNTRQRFRDVFWGAITASLLWNLLKFLFNLYLTNFSNLGSIYGVIAAVIGAIVWVYLSTSIIIFGAEVTMILGLRTKGVPAPSLLTLLQRATRRIATSVPLAVPWLFGHKGKPPELEKMEKESETIENTGKENVDTSQSVDDKNKF